MHTHRFLTATFCGIMLLLSSATFMRNTVWRDELVLWKDVVEKSPGKARGHYHVGLYYDGKDRFEEAIREYRTVVSLASVVRWDSVSNRARNNLGSIYGKQGRFEEAIREFQMVLQSNPDDVAGHTNLGIVFGKQGRMNEALGEFHRALQADPNNAAAHYSLGK